VNANRLGHRVAFLSAVGDDERGKRAVCAVRDLGLATEFIQTVPEVPTGTVTVRVDAGGQPAYVIHRPAAYDFVDLDGRRFSRLAAVRPDWICYGTLQAMATQARALVRRVLARFPTAQRFYDVNLRPDSYTLELVEEWLSLATLVKWNEDEMRTVQALRGGPVLENEAFCRSQAEKFGWKGVCVTRGENGCALLLNGEYVEVPGRPVTVADTVGAGDAFSAALLHGIQAGWPPYQIGEFANRLGALVASRPGALPPWSPKELL
jgi:fructokinase